VGIQNSLEQQIEMPAFAVSGLVISFVYMEIISISQSANVKTLCKIFSQSVYSFDHFRAEFETANSTGFPSEAISKPMNDKKVFGSSEHGFTKGKCHHCFQPCSHWCQGQGKGSGCHLT